MDKPARISAENCKAFEPRMFVVDHAAGEKVLPEIAALLDPVNPASYHFWEMKKEQATELHYHEHDEYWAWARGKTMLTIRLPDGRKDTFEIGPGCTVYCVRGVEHGHQPLEEWACFEWTSAPREGAQSGHLLREL